MAVAEPAGSCRVDFYVLEDATLSAEALACRLTLMAWEKGLSVTLLTENRQHAEQMDAMLWEHPPGRFIPHELADSGRAAPVSIATAGHDPQCDVLINLTRRPIAQPGRFQRLLEVVPASSEDRQASRDKFKTYRSMGLQPAHHPMGRS